MKPPEHLTHGPEHTLLSLMEDPVVVLSKKALVVYVNPAFRRRFSVERELAVGLPISEVLTSSLSSPILEHLNLLEPEGAAHNFWMGSDGSRFRVSMTTVTLKDRVAGAVLTIWDATREAATKASNLEMFRTMIEDVRVPMEVLSEFLRETAGAGPGRHAEQLTESLARLSDFGEVLCGDVRVERTPFDPARLLTLAQKSLRPLAEQRGVYLEDGSSRELPRLVGDPALLNRLLGLLVDYMIKTVPENEMVIISCELLEGASGPPSLAYSISGTGIVNLESDLLKGESSISKSFAGLADVRKRMMLRLLLARRLVAAMSGVVTVAAHERAGATITARVPIQVHHGTG